MRIREILKDTQPDNYRKLVKGYNKKAERITEKEIENLMKHRAYKRGTGGAIRQVR